MASALTVNTTTRAGTDQAATLVSADAAGNYWPTTGAEWLVVTNGGGSAITVSLVIQQKVDTVTPAARTVSVPAGKTYIIGPFPSAYNDNNNPARMNVTYSAVTTVTVGVFTLGT